MDIPKVLTIWARRRRGGQGDVAAAEFQANAAFRSGKFVQPFPSFGAEREKSSGCEEIGL
jgi:hypothetical protein